MHRVPAGFPFGMPGIGEEIEGSIQQAPHFARQDNLLMMGDFNGNRAQGFA
jgi:hypothetical protein